MNGSLSLLDSRTFPHHGYGVGIVQTLAAGYAHFGNPFASLGIAAGAGVPYPYDYSPNSNFNGHGNFSVDGILSSRSLAGPPSNSSNGSLDKCMDPKSPGK
jgi:hypothetical protein